MAKGCAYVLYLMYFKTHGFDTYTIINIYVHLCDIDDSNYIGRATAIAGAIYTIYYARSIQYIVIYLNY